MSVKDTPSSAAIQDVESRQRGGSHVDSSADAVCFTAGTKGAPFAAGVIHAYLVADRKPPAVAAGVSLGALSAAAMQRCYKELEEVKHEGTEKREVARWRWFRTYITALCDNPLSVIWDGLPDQSDFFADIPPVKDPTPAVFKDHGAAQEFQQMEVEARRELYLLVRLGNWLASLSVSVSRIADLLVHRVRAKENYPGPRIWREAKYMYRFVALGLMLLWHVAMSPKWFPEYKFARKARRFPVRPLFGWPLFGGAWVCLVALGLVLLALVVCLVHLILPESLQLGNSSLNQPRLFSFALLHSCSIAPLLFYISLAFFVFIVTARWMYPARCKKFVAQGIQRILHHVELEKHLVHDFHLRIRLITLFGVDGVSPPVDDEPMAVVLVTAPLQTLTENGNPVPAPQLWAHKNTPLVDALCASLAVPGLFSPVNLKNGELKYWLHPHGNLAIEGGLQELDLVDGSVIRRNAIPALFSFLKNEGKDIARALSSSEGDPRVHVVYEVPIGAKPETAGPGFVSRDIVDVGMASLQLVRRRDTELEVLQTNFTSRLEEEIRKTSSCSPNLFPIFADEIAPEIDISINHLDPEPEKILSKVADGCRRTLEVLYRNNLEEASIPCPELLLKLDDNPVRRARETPGLPEVCAHCCKVLNGEPKRVRTPARADSEVDLSIKFPQLTGTEPRIVFLASGGVFRGPFHAGMLACLLVTQIRPQLIVGASVGTLMGGALGAMLSTSSYDDSLRLLRNVVDVCLHLDERVAFTKILKNATRELGIRGRAIDLSPNDLRRMIKRGARSDAGFAQSGAPSALIDAISDLFMIPHRQTSEIAAGFVSGHITGSVNKLLEQLKEETLGRLNIRSALIGTSLLQATARELLGEKVGLNLNSDQPYKNIGFFGTSANLDTESVVVLGRYRAALNDSYNFLEAALASSAFPCVFAPRKESDVFPGRGRVSTLFSDGGVFDNLPFIPALNLLSDVQEDYQARTNDDPIEFLRLRHSCPDLFIVGSLDVRAEIDEDGKGPFDDLVTIFKRGNLLHHNVKIASFQESSRRIHEQLDRLLAAKSVASTMSNQALLNGIVDAATLAVFPTDSKHLNPTFAFCASTGFRKERVRKSIADGCFQTFASLVESPKTGSAVLKKSLRRLVGEKIPLVDVMKVVDKGTENGYCPFFMHSADTVSSHSHGKLEQASNPANPARFKCPFFLAAQREKTNAGAKAVLEVYSECVKDPAHKSQWARSVGLEGKPSTTVSLEGSSSFRKFAGKRQKAHGC